MRERASIFSHIDLVLFFTWLTLALAGVFAIYSATSDGSFANILSLSGQHSKQFIFLGVSFIVMLIILTLDYDFLIGISPIIYVATLLLLILTLGIGSEINGAKSWIKIGSIQIQPAEFSKTGTALMLSWWFHYNSKVFKTLKGTALTFLIILIPMILILLQGDLGSMLTFTILIFVFYREGFNPALIYIGLLMIAIGLTTLIWGSIKVSIALLLVALIIFFFNRNTRGFWKPLTVTTIAAIGFSFVVKTAFGILKNYQQDRILILIGLKEDLHGSGYNLWQSKMAISSGRLFGKGYLQGVQTQGDFIPEVHTDYIFASIGEEWGFIGSLFIVGLFAVLIFRLLTLAERQKATFSRVFLYCTAGFFTIHVFINIGMVIGIFPTAGIPLPFFSYGGSSLLSFSVIIALALRLDAQQPLLI